MKTYVISDLHGNLGGLDPSGCELCIIAGDFSLLKNLGKWHVYDQKKWIEKKFIPWMVSFPHTNFVITPGNHDLCLDIKKTSAWPDLNWKISWPTNAHILINSMIDINGLKIYGTPCIPIINYRWAFECEHDDLYREFSNIPTGLDILISHSPPRIPDCNIDYSLQTQYGPFGSSELTQAIFMKQPRYVFCGHIHSGDHSQQSFENSKLYNVSRLDEQYEIGYEPLTLDI